MLSGILPQTDKKIFYPHGVYFRLYIDWNHDGDWDDAGEMVVDSFKDKVRGNRVRKFKESFVVPEHTREGPFWARAWVSYGFPSPVNGDFSTSFGEIEDYNLFDEGG
jgi:hypothetical protein